jgi:predicted MFS family arabinose efflux permease
LTVAALAYRRIKGKIWTIGSFILPVTLFLFSFTRILPLSFLLLIGVGWGLMTIANTTNAMVQEETPDELRSRVMSLYVLVFQGGMPIGALVIGLLAAGLTAPVTVAICAVILLGYAVFSVLKRPEIRITP